MMIVLISISIIVILGSLIYCFCDGDREIAGFVGGVGCLGLVIKLIVVVSLMISLVQLKVVDDKIKLYTNQNKEIENKVEVVVKQYIEHEHKTFKELKTNESYITLITLYPELKSDKLIEKEINLYTENNKKILELKEQKVSESIYKWWLYFG